MSKVFKGLLLIFIIVGCSSDNPESEMPNPENPTSNENENPVEQNPDQNDVQTTSLFLEGIDNLDIDALTVVSVGGEGSINENRLENLYAEVDDDLPVFFRNGDDVMFGYFPNMINNGSITLDDITFFFFKTYPDLAVQKIADGELKTILFDSPSFDAMKTIISNALNNNEPPTSSNELDEIIREILVDNDTENGQSSKTIVDEFRFNYSRSGKIGIPRKAPIFSSLGVQVNRLGGNQPVFGPKLLDTKSLVFSPGSLFSFLLDYYFFEEGSEEVEEIDLLDYGEGEYEILFSNGGIGTNTEFDETVRNQNYRNFAVTALGYATPFGLEKLLSKTECRNETTKLIESTVGAAGELFRNGSKPDAAEMITIITDLGKDIGNASVCYLAGEADDSFTKYLGRVINFGAKRLKIAEDISELVFLARDFYGSNISGSETRYFYNGQSFGKLEMQVNSSTEIQVPEQTEFGYSAQINELEISYDVDISLLESKFIRKENLVPGRGLAFNIESVPDDGIIPPNSQPLISDSDGRLNYTFISGSQDLSIYIGPSFLTSDIGEVVISLEIIEEQTDIESEILDFLTKNQMTLEPTDGCSTTTIYDYPEDRFDRTEMDNNCNGLASGFIFLPDFTVLLSRYDDANEIIIRDVTSDYKIIGETLEFNYYLYSTATTTPGTYSTIAYTFVGQMVEINEFNKQFHGQYTYKTFSTNPSLDRTVETSGNAILKFN